MNRDDTRAAILALFSMHMPEVRAYGDGETPEFYVGCSCGKALYVGHLSLLLTDRLVTEPQPESESA